MKMMPFTASASARLLVRLGAIACAGAATLASAQSQPPGQTTTTIGAVGISQLKADLDGGGKAGWNSLGVNLSVAHQFSPAFSASVRAGYAAEDWRFDTPTAFGASAPWGRINRPSLGFNFSYATSADVAWFVAPQFQWDYESDASAADGLSYGAVFGVTKVYSPTLVLGIGLGVFRQIDDTKYFPFLIVNWQIDDKLRVSNPLPAGPAGGAGLELVYALDQGWELAGGAAYRDYRFRLNADAAAPDGIGRNTGIPVFARLTRKFGPAARIDFYAGLVADGKLRLLDTNGETLRSADYGTAPLLGITGSYSF
ncbi:MAG: hypothetical protein M9915_07295 [Rhizobacter sp.]|nr:hypothetical protein [Rhizobacter sp.]